MDAWALAYPASTVNYAAVGSGAGISDITAKAVDFGASDAPLNVTQRAAAPGVLTFPESTGALVPIYNLPGVPFALKFTGQILAAIYLGNLTNWNNTALQAVNPGVTLPHAAILPVHRSDGSGTTFVWSSYLSASNATWAATVGRGTTVHWPAGGIGSVGDSGVVASVKSTNDTIGYVDLTYALVNSVAFGSVENPAGNYIFANVTNLESAVQDANPTFPTPTGDWYNVSVLNAPGPEDYPISTLTYVLVYQNLSAAYPAYTLAKAENLVDFLWWMVSVGQQYSAPMYYAPLPPSIVSLDESSINSMTFNSSAIPRCGATQSYPVTFSETGLPTGASWSVSLGGASPVGSMSGTISFSELNGTYPYRISDVPGWHQSTIPYAGNLTVDGGPVSEEGLVFVRESYSVTFTETGLPDGASWSVALGGSVMGSMTNSLVFTEPNGTYTFTVGPVAGYAANRSVVQITLQGFPMSVPLLFSSNRSSSATLLNLPNNEGYALVGGIVAVVLAMAAVALLRRRQRGRPNSGASPPPTGDRSPPPSR